MNTKLNLALLNTTRFDSGALGLIAMVIHQFAEPGNYRGSVLREGDAAADLNIVVDEKSDVMQLDIDLAAIARQPRPGAHDCGCGPKSDRTQHVVSPKGYVLFHASSRGGYAVNVAHTDGKSKFDSTQLENGDLFALSLLEPAQYVAINTFTKAQMDIAVDFPTDPEAGSAARRKAAESINVNVDGCKFHPPKISVISTQGVVFRISEKARIVIEKRINDIDVKTTAGPSVRWQKLETAAVKPGKQGGKAQSQAK